MTALEVDGLDVRFGDAPGLHGITFGVERGERFVLVGASGSGKTSLLKALVGALPRAAGRVRIDGQDVTGWPVERRPAVLLAQTPLLFPHLTVFENVAFPLRVRRVASSEVVARVNGALAAVRMADLGARSPSTLSGGQARRVALARAVVARPPLLLLDEPLSALDPALREEIRGTILDLHADYRPALVMVTHDLAEAGRIADRVGVLVDGLLAQIGSPAEVFGRPASLAVARFLGLANELEAVLHPDGTLMAAGVRVPWMGEPGTAGPSGTGSEARPPRPDSHARRMRVVFGVDGAELVQPHPAAPPTVGPNEGEGVLIGRVTRIMHQPEGATARIETGAGPVEVRIPFDLAPTLDGRVGLRLLPRRVHVYEGHPESVS